MKKQLLTLCMGLVCLLMAIPQADAQSSFFKKVKKKAEDAAVDKMFEPNKESQDPQKTNTVYSTSEGNSENSPSNTRGGGLNSSAPDVLANIGNAESSYNNKEYSNSRFAVRQAILGVELEIGKNILDELPTSINGLPMVAAEDQVTSSGIGFVGLIISRVYRGNDQEFRVTVGNDAAMLSAANMYLASGAYASSSQDENIKQTTYKDELAVIQYDELEGYQLSVPFGQSSILMTQGINYSTEDEFMGSSNEVDLNNIKNQLGEK